MRDGTLTAGATATWMYADELELATCEVAELPAMLGTTEALRRRLLGEGCEAGEVLGDQL